MIHSIISLVIGWFVTYKVPTILNLNNMLANIIKIVGIIFIIIGLIGLIKAVAVFVGLS